MGEQIKPCPFCGGKAKLMDLWATGIAVECCTTRCFISGPERKTKRGAIAAWNRRASNG